MHNLSYPVTEVSRNVGKQMIANVLKLQRVMHLKNPNIEYQPLKRSIFRVSMKSNDKVINGKCK